MVGFKFVLTLKNPEVVEKLRQLKKQHVGITWDGLLLELANYYQQKEQHDLLTVECFALEEKIKELEAKVKQLEKKLGGERDG